MAHLLIEIAFLPKGFLRNGSLKADAHREPCLSTTIGHLGDTSICAALLEFNANPGGAGMVRHPPVFTCRKYWKASWWLQ